MYIFALTIIKIQAVDLAHHCGFCIIPLEELDYLVKSVTLRKKNPQMVTHFSLQAHGCLTLLILPVIQDLRQIRVIALNLFTSQVILGPILGNWADTVCV